MFMFMVMISTPLPPLTNRSHRGGDQSGSLPSRGYVKLLNQHSMLKIVRISKIRVMRTPADYLDKVLLGVQPAQTARENKQLGAKRKQWAQPPHICVHFALWDGAHAHLQQMWVWKGSEKQKSSVTFSARVELARLDTGHTLWRRAHAKMKGIGWHCDKERGHWSMQRCCLPVSPDCHRQMDRQMYNTMGF